MMSKPKRLHPVAVLKILIKNLTVFVQSIIGFSIIILASPISKEWIIAIGALIIVLYVVFTVLSWLRFSYYVDESELKIEQGIFARQSTHIPFERIQSVQISSDLIHRMFGLVKLEVQTAGGTGKAEASLAAITKTEAKNLETRLQVTKQNNIESEEAEPEPTIKRELSIKHLLITASTSNGLGVVFIGLVAVLSQVDRVIQDEDVYSQIGEYVVNLFGKGIFIWVIGLFFLFLVAWIASILGSIITTGGFNLTRYSDRIQVSRGLLNKRKINIPLKRIQAVKIVEGIFRQPLGFVSIHIISAGNNDEAIGDILLFPLLPKKEVFAFIEAFLPEFKLDNQVTPLAKAAQSRYRLIFSIPALLISLPIIIIFKYGFLTLLLPLAFYLFGIKRYHDAGWKIMDNQLTIRSRRLGLVTLLIKKERIQYFQLQQNPLQGRRGLKTFQINIASSIGGTQIGLYGINVDDSDQIMNWFLNP